MKTPVSRAEGKKIGLVGICGSKVGGSWASAIDRPQRTKNGVGGDWCPSEKRGSRRQPFSARPIAGGPKNLRTRKFRSESLERNLSDAGTVERNHTPGRGG